MKWNIARHLADMGCRVTILPGTATAEEILASEPDGVFLSNGPGDPEPLEYAIGAIRGVLGRDARVRHLPGAPASVAGLRGQDIQAQVRPSRRQSAGAEPRNGPGGNHLARTTASPWPKTSLPPELEVTHRNLNDQTIEGVRHRGLPAFSVQYHPEASAGPHDSNYLFGRFWELMGRGQAPEARDQEKTAEPAAI